jgi:hypothetical protein
MISAIREIIVPSVKGYFRVAYFAGKEKTRTREYVRAKAHPLVSACHGIEAGGSHGLG